MAGAMMCEGVSSRSWMIYSPRSVSTTANPASARAALRPISSATIDLPLAIVLAPCAMQSLDDDCRSGFGGSGEMHGSARLAHALLVSFEIEIEMGQRVVLDVARVVAQRFEFRQACDGSAPFLDESRAQIAQRLLQLRIGEGATSIALELLRTCLGGHAAIGRGDFLGKDNMPQALRELRVPVFSGSFRAWDGSHAAAAEAAVSAPTSDAHRASRLLNHVLRRRVELLDDRLNFQARQRIDVEVRLRRLGEERRIRHGLVEAVTQRLQHVAGYVRRCREGSGHRLGRDRELDDLTLFCLGDFIEQ